MAAETFIYTDSSVSPPTSFTLTFDAVAGHLMGDKEYIAMNQIQDTTIAGGRMTSNLGDSFKRYDFTAIVPLASGSTGRDYADILNFIGSNNVNGSVNSFVWTNHASVERTVKIINMSISVETIWRNGIEHKKVKFLLEQVN